MANKDDPKKSNSGSEEELDLMQFFNTRKKESSEKAREEAQPESNAAAPEAPTESTEAPSTESDADVLPEEPSKADDNIGSPEDEPGEETEPAATAEVEEPTKPTESEASEADASSAAPAEVEEPTKPTESEASEADASSAAPEEASESVDGADEAPEAEESEEDAEEDSADSDEATDVAESEDESGISELGASLEKEKKPVKKKPEQAKNMQAKKGLVLTGIIFCSFIAVVLIILLAAYLWLGSLYNNAVFETANRETHDLRELMEIFKDDLDADVSEYPQDEVDNARSATVLNNIDFLPNTDYRPIVDALTADRNADLSSYGFTIYQTQIIRWAIYYGFSDRLLEIPAESVSGDIPVPPPDDPWSSIDPDDTGEPETSVGSDTEEAETTKKPASTYMSDPPDDNPPTHNVGVGFETEPPAVVGGKVTDADIYNVLILGCDTRGNNLSGRTDTIIIASINRVSKRIVLTSIQRDTIVKDPETGGYAKINSFFARSATSTGQRVGRVMNAIKHNFDIDIDNYALINFAAFEKVIGVFGTVEVPLYYSEYLKMREMFPSGSNKIEGLGSLFTDKAHGYITVKLNGTQALAYARMRSNLYNPITHTWQRSSDAWRTERQRNVIHGLIREIRHMTLNQLIDLSNSVFPYITTDLDYNSFLARLMNYTDFAKYSVDSFNASGVRYSWYPCTTDGYKIYLQGTAGYGTGYQGVAIFEPYMNGRNGYNMIKNAWKEKVYK